MFIFGVIEVWKSDSSVSKIDRFDVKGSENIVVILVVSFARQAEDIEKWRAAAVVHIKRDDDDDDEQWGKRLVVVTKLDGIFLKDHMIICH